MEHTWRVTPIVGPTVPGASHITLRRLPPPISISSTHDIGICSCFGVPPSYRWCGCAGHGSACAEGERCDSDALGCGNASDCCAPDAQGCESTRSATVCVEECSKRHLRLARAGAMRWTLRWELLLVPDADGMISELFPPREHHVAPPDLGQHRLLEGPWSGRFDFGQPHSERWRERLPLPPPLVGPPS